MQILFCFPHIRRAAGLYHRAMARIVQLDLLELGLALSFALLVLTIVNAAGGGR